MLLFKRVREYQLYAPVHRFPFQKLIRIHVHAIKSSGNLHVEKAAGRRSFINR